MAGSVQSKVETTYAALNHTEKPRMPIAPLLRRAYLLYVQLSKCTTRRTYLMRMSSGWTSNAHPQLPLDPLFARKEGEKGQHHLPSFLAVMLMALSVCRRWWWAVHCVSGASEGGRERHWDSTTTARRRRGWTEIYLWLSFCALRRTYLEHQGGERYYW